MTDASLASPIVAASAIGIGLALAQRCAGSARFASLSFLLAFGLRAACALAVHWSQLVTRGTSALFQDDHTNDLVASWLIRIASGEPIAVFIGHEHLLEDTYVYLLTLLYLVLGHDPLAAKLLSAFFGAAAVLVTYDLAVRTTTPAAGRVAALLAAAFPSLVLWNSLAVKEGLTLLLSLVLLRTLALAANGARPLAARGAAWFGVVAVLLASLRLPAIAVIVTLTPLAALARVSTLAAARRIRIGLLLAAIALTGVGLGLVLVSPAGRTYVNEEQLGRLAQTIQIKRVLMGERGETSLLEPELRDRELAEAQPATMRDVLGYLPEGVRDALLAPFPWSARTTAERIFALEMIAWYAVLGLAVLGTWRLARERSPELLVLLAYLGTNLLIIAVFDANLGTLVRHRTSLYPATFVLASAGWMGLMSGRVVLPPRRRAGEPAALESVRR